VADELTPEEAADKLNFLEITRTFRATEARDFKNFFRGEQPLKYASEEWSKEHQTKYKDFSDNWCEVVANSTAERINLTGFRLSPQNTGAGKPGMTPAEKKLWETWRRAEGEYISQQGILETVVARRSYGYVWRMDDDSPIIDWKEAESCIVQYDPITGRIPMYGVLTWDDIDRERQYAHLYTKKQVYQFWRPKLRRSVPGLTLDQPTYELAGGWQFDADGSGDNHLGEVPIVEFPNRPQLGFGPLSDISGVKAMQEAINLLWAYLFASADYASMPARVVMGQAPPKIPILDQNGVKIGERPIDSDTLTKGRMLWLTGQGATIGQWEAASLDVFTSVVETAVGHIAAQTRTPPHYLVANKGLSNLSGDALKAAEAGLIAKVKQTISYLEMPTRRMFRLIALQLGDAKLADRCLLGTPIWGDIESRSEAQAADAMLKRRQAGYPFEYLLEEMGKNPVEIDRIMAMKEAEAQANAQAAMGAMGEMLTAPGIPAAGGEQPPAPQQEQPPAEKPKPAPKAKPKSAPQGA
jgi:hypothetical protein